LDELKLLKKQGAINIYLQYKDKIICKSGTDIREMSRDTLITLLMVAADSGGSAKIALTSNVKTVANSNIMDLISEVQTQAQDAWLVTNFYLPQKIDTLSQEEIGTFNVVDSFALNSVNYQLINAVYELEI